MKLTPRGKWGNPGHLSIRPHKYNTNHGYAEKLLSMLRTSNIVTSNMLIVSSNPQFWTYSQNNKMEASGITPRSGGNAGRYYKT